MRRLALIPTLFGLLTVACDPGVQAPMPADRSLGIESAAALSPDEQAALTQMAAQIQAWIAGGVLTAGQGNALLAKLQAAESQLIGGNPAGKNVMQAFVNQVTAFVQAGIITSAQGALLTGPASGVIGGDILFTSITAGDQHACGLASGGYVYCWGANSEGQLGDGTLVASARPVLVSATTTYTAIGAGSAYTCALTAAGVAECWGNNAGGQLGNGSMINRSIPTPVSGGHTFASISVGGIGACGLTAGGAAWCWGAGGRIGIDMGGLGAPATETCPGTYASPWPCRTVPVQVSGGLTFISIDVGIWSACGLTTSNTAFCWGWNQFYQLGNGTNVNGLVPAAVVAAPAFASLGTGAVHSCGIDGSGAGWCWGGLGFNWGQLGNGTTLPAPTPVAMIGGHSFRSISPSNGNDIYAFTCGIDTGDRAFCWGANTQGQLGAPTTELCQGSIPCATSPVAVTGNLSFREISPSAEFVCGVTTSSEGYCWGQNTAGQLGNGSTTNAAAPTRVVR